MESNTSGQDNSFETGKDLTLVTYELTSPWKYRIWCFFGFYLELIVAHVSTYEYAYVYGVYLCIMWYMLRLQTPASPKLHPEPKQWPLLQNHNTPDTGFFISSSYQMRSTGGILPLFQWYFKSSKASVCPKNTCSFAEQPRRDRQEFVTINSHCHLRTQSCHCYLAGLQELIEIL